MRCAIVSKAFLYSALDQWKDVQKAALDWAIKKKNFFLLFSIEFVDFHKCRSRMILFILKRSNN